jgi:hypothetical protein
LQVLQVLEKTFWNVSKQENMPTRTNFVHKSLDMFLNVWFLDSKTFFCLQTQDQPKNWKLLVLACFVLVCKNIFETCFCSFLLASTRLADTCFRLVFASLVCARKNVYLLAHTRNKRKRVRTCNKILFVCLQKHF